MEGKRRVSEYRGSKKKFPIFVFCFLNFLSFFFLIERKEIFKQLPFLTKQNHFSPIQPWLKRKQHVACLELPERYEVGASKDGGRDHKEFSLSDLRTAEKDDSQFFKAGPNGGTDPSGDGVGIKRVLIGEATAEAHLSDVAGSVESEHSIHENGEPSEQFKLFIFEIVRVVG